ncbi:hypothetical protein ACRAWD_27305 [Caulobacter segnis]
MGDYLRRERFSDAFRDDHLLPLWRRRSGHRQPARCWTYPAQAFIRFCDNHELLRLMGRPVWRTVVGGGCAYVERLAGLSPRSPGQRRHSGSPRCGRRVVGDALGREGALRPGGDRAHANEALAMLARQTPLAGIARVARRLWL